MSSLKVEVAGSKASLSGFLDENSDLSALKGLTGDAVIDFAGVSRVNSCGVREWVNCIMEIQANLTYENCPLVVVKQLNAVPDFQGKAKVTSFQAPYFCEDCDEEMVQQLSGDMNPDSPPGMKCSSCGNEMNFDGVPGQYFGFLKRAA